MAEWSRPWDQASEIVTGSSLVSNMFTCAEVESKWLRRIGHLLLASFADRRMLGGITRFIAARGLEFGGMFDKFLDKMFPNH